MRFDPVNTVKPECEQYYHQSCQQKSKRTDTSNKSDCLKQGFTNEYNFKIGKSQNRRQHPDKKIVD